MRYNLFGKMGVNMKKAMKIFLSLFMAGTFCGCSGNPSASVKQESSSAVSEKEEAAVQEEEQIDDPAWDALKDMGKVKTENGLFYVYVTVPQSFAGEGVTQEEIDAGAGERYTSGTLNEDGSVTYKMTKKQHKAMLDAFRESFDQAFAEMADSPDYAISEITHNDDFTSFDVKLSTDELGMTESFLVMAFYMYGGMYSLFSGKEGENITVNYYSASGELIQTANSSDIEQ